MDRAYWVILSRSWRDWKETLVIVKPETVLRWHRKHFASYWTRLSLQRRPGRPGKDRGIRELIRRIENANIPWDSPRVHGELLKLGIDVSERTVSRWIPRQRKPPSQTWRTFLDSHVGDLVSIDFFAAPTAAFRVLFVLVVLAHDRRRIVHFNVTDHPTADWTSQQLMEEFSDRKLLRFLICDRDAVYGSTFRERVKVLGIEEVVIAPRSPWQSPYVEKVIGTLRRECLDHVLVLGEAHLRRMVQSYVSDHHRARTHMALGKDAAEPRAVHPPGNGDVIEVPEVGGLHHRYERRAAWADGSPLGSQHPNLTQPHCAIAARPRTEILFGRRRLPLPRTHRPEEARRVVRWSLGARVRIRCSDGPKFWRPHS